MGWSPKNEVVYTYLNPKPFPCNINHFQSVEKIIFWIFIAFNYRIDYDFVYIFVIRCKIEIIRYNNLNGLRKNKTKTQFIG